MKKIISAMLSMVIAMGCCISMTSATKWYDVRTTNPMLHKIIEIRHEHDNLVYCVKTLTWEIEDIIYGE